MNANIRLRVLPALLPVDGRNVEFQATETHIQVRYVPIVGSPTAWTDLVPFTDITGPIGPETELRVADLFLQYRAEGAAEWINLLPISDITNGVSAEVAALRDETQGLRDETEELRDSVLNAAADAVSQGNVPIYATVDGLSELPGGLIGFQTRGFHADGAGPGLFVDPVDTDPSRGDYIEVSTGPVGGPFVSRWYREAQETGRIDLARHGLFGDAATNNLRDETAAFIDAIEVMADRGLLGISSPGGLGYKLIRGVVPADFDFDGGGSTLFADFDEHEVGDNYAYTLFSTVEADQRKIALRNLTLNGQNNPSVVMQGGEPLLYFGGGEIILDRLVMTRGANRRYTNGVNPTPTEKNDQTNAEILFRNPKRVTIDRSEFRSSPGEMVQIADDFAAAIVQVTRSRFTKKRDLNSGLWSSSGLNVFNALSTYVAGNLFEDFVKGAANFESDNTIAEYNIVRRVSDSNGFDFCEARSLRTNSLLVRGNYFEDIVGVAVRASGTNVLVEGNTYNRVNIATSNEGAVVAGTATDAWIKDDAAPLYNFLVRNQTYKDWDSAHADLIGVRALGASASMPVHVIVEGNALFDRPSLASSKALYGVWLENAEAVLSGRHAVGRTALVRATGTPRIYGRDCQFAPEDISGDGAHVFEFNAATLNARSLILDNCKRETVHAAGWYDFRNTSSTIDLDAIHINNSPNFEGTTNNAIIRRNGLLAATATFDPGSISAGAQVTTTVTVTGARLGDEAGAFINTSQNGLGISAYVSASNTVTVIYSNLTGAAVDLVSHTVTAITRKL